MTPFFSLILPCYNVAQYLERCVRSIFTQDFADYEIILVDDGSTDATSALCDAMAAEYACVRVIHKANGGLSSARNAGLDAAKGSFVWFIDSDDWIEERALVMIHQACCDGDVDVVKFDHYRVEAFMEAVRCEVAPGLYQGEALEQLRRQAFCEAGRYGLSACMHVYRRELLEQHGLRFVSERQVGSEDYLFNLQALLHVRGLRMLCCPLYSYERRVGSLTQTYKTDLAQRYTSMREQLIAYYRDAQTLERYGAFIDRFFLWHLIIGTCVMRAYDTAAFGHTVREARQSVRDLLRMKAVRQAAKRSDKTGLPWKKRILLLALWLRLESLFHRVYAAKPDHHRG